MPGNRVQSCMGLCRWGLAVAVCLIAGAGSWAQVAPIPTQNALPGHPFAIRHTWVIGGTGPWDYLAMDAAVGQLLIAHGPAVQVVDVSTGSVAGTVNGFRDAHAIALDDAGDEAYVTDGPANLVRVFDRRSFQVLANISTAANPRALTLEPATGLLFVICSGSSGAGEETGPEAGQRGTAHRNPHPHAASGVRASQLVSIVTVIDPRKRRSLLDILVPGRLGSVQPDGAGGVYFTVEDANQIARLDGQTVANAVQELPSTAPDDAAGKTSSTPSASKTPILDWTVPAERAKLHIIRAGQECQQPRGIAVDAHDGRLFVSCRNQHMAVINAESGEGIAGFTIGPDADSIVWDPARSLIFTANGGGYGSVTVIRRDVTDTYAVVQNLPTLHQARTMALNSSTGEVYVVTTLYGADVSHTPVNGIGTLKMNPVNGSFQVLVIGN